MQIPRSGPASVGHGGGERGALRERTCYASVTWRVELDERWVVLGPNGAGKTTLLNLAAARLHPTDGTVHVLGERLGRIDVMSCGPASACPPRRWPTGFPPRRGSTTWW